MKTRYKQKRYYTNPQGYELEHKRGLEACKGFDYMNSNLNLTSNHKLQQSIEKSIGIFWE